jgi:hypothetical protein
MPESRFLENLCALSKLEVHKDAASPYLEYICRLGNQYSAQQMLHTPYAISHGECFLLRAEFVYSNDRPEDLLLNRGAALVQACGTI